MNFRKATDEELFEEIYKLKSKFIQVGSPKEEVYAPDLRCMDTDFVRDCGGCTTSVALPLCRWVRRGYVNLSLTQQGREFIRQCLESYERNERNLALERKRRAEMRAQIRRAALRTPFELESVEFIDVKPAVLRGWYKGEVDVEVVVSFGWASPGNCTYCSMRLILARGQTVVGPQKGELFKKVLRDVICALESPSGRLWRLKAGSKAFWAKALEVIQREISEVKKDEV